MLNLYKHPVQKRRRKMENYQFSVDLGGMIAVLSEHLYSSPDVFLRELIQNSADAISMRRELDKGFNGGEINISAEKYKSITFCDNGIGLTEREIHDFVSVIGQSSKRGENGSYIGRFGIGLLSCFIVTDEIVLRSRSAKAPEKAVEWHGFADGRYSVSEIDSDMPIGTEIYFRCSNGFEKYFDTDYLEEKARYFALPLPYPIYISKGGGLSVRANVMFSGGAGNSHTFQLEAGKRIFGAERDFLDVIPLESPTGLFSGFAYILSYTVSASGSGNRHRIYLKNILLTEDGSSLIPEWGFFVRCIINTHKLCPTASREDFYHDSLLEKAKNEITLCIADYLEKLSLSDTAMLSRIGSLHGIALRSVASTDDRLFRIFMPYFSFDTSLGLITGREVTDCRNTVYFTSDTDIFRQLRPIFAEQNIMLVDTSYVHTKELLIFAAREGLIDLQPLRENIIEESLNECEDKEKFSAMILSFNSTLSEFGCRAVMKTYSPSQLASLYSPNADAELKRDIERSKENGDSLFADMLDAFNDEIAEEITSVLYLNSSNDLINKISAVGDAEKLTAFAKILYVQSLISGGFPVYSKVMGIMNENLIKLIEWGI